MAFRVELSRGAKRNLDDLLHWLTHEQAGDAGQRWFVGLQGAIASLTHSPRRCALAQESQRSGREIRQLLYGNRPNTYRVLFIIEGELVNILEIRHGRRLPSRLI